MVYGLFYRLVMRVAHRFDWHYAPVIGPLDAGGPDDPRHGRYQRWCRWCGFRESFRREPSVKTRAEQEAEAQIKALRAELRRAEDRAARTE